jgi:glycosyltransferase involved in cell wall biosynthesis
MNAGGVETWLLQVLRHIDRDRFQFDFCTFGPEPGLLAPDVEALGGKILRCPRDVNVWTFSRRFRRILRDGNYQIAHSHVQFFSGALLRWAKAEGVPIRIAHSHNTSDGRLNTGMRRFYRRLMKSWIDRYATYGLAASSAAAVALFGENWQADGRFRVLHYGIDLHLFQDPVDRRQVPKELGIPADAPVVGHVGRFDPQKNHRFLLDVARETLKRRPDVHFLLVGDGPLRVEIEALARGMGLSGKTHFVGIRTDVPRLMRGAMDLFVFPSIYEGLGIALLEAQAAGLPCLISDAVPAEVAISPSSAEFLALSSGAQYWARRIVTVLAQKRRAADPGECSKISTHFSIQRSVRELTEIYGSQPECARMRSAVTLGSDTYSSNPR